jgi:hypothetical protein
VRCERPISPTKTVADKETEERVEIAQADAVGVAQAPSIGLQLVRTFMVLKVWISPLDLLQGPKLCPAS